MAMASNVALMLVQERVRRGENCDLCVSGKQKMCDEFRASKKSKNTALIATEGNYTMRKAEHGVAHDRFWLGKRPNSGSCDAERLQGADINRIINNVF